ncbi:MAG: ABC transporter permease [Sphingomonadaceae bacterium]
MKRILASAMVIARRDYIATVWSRSFLLFLLGPIVAGLFGGLLGGIGGKVDEAVLRPSVAVIASARATAPIDAAYKRLERNIAALPELRTVEPKGPPEAQARALLGAANKSASVVITGWPDAPRMVGPQGQIDALTPQVRLLFDEVATAGALQSRGVPRTEITFTTLVTDPVHANTSVSRHIVARLGQVVLFILTIMLAGMLLSNLVEEKSNKVIEVLAAAVPVDAIFLGKLIAMLSVSLTGIAVWGVMLAGGIVATLEQGAIPAPAVGWPVYAVLGIIYFVMNYMILGGLFLGIGAQASTVREVQTLSMPITMAQLGIFALGSAVVADLDTTLGLSAALFPLSSPIVMIARGAQEATLWPHLLAFVWQGLWVAIIIRFAAGRFRVGVLKSGGPRRAFWRRKATA